MSKSMTDAQFKAVKKLEDAADALVEKQTFESCLSAIDCYINAQDKLHKAANDDSIENAKPYPAFNSDNVTYNAWYASLANKMSYAQMMLADPRLAKK